MKKFEFGTKADNLIQLKSRLSTCIIPNLKVFDIKSWKKNEVFLISQLKYQFSEKVIVRSNAEDEDSHKESLAGYYASVSNIKAAETTSIKNAISKVIASYKRSFINTDDQSFFIQDMVTNPRACGVILTRCENGAPYYVITQDLGSGRTDIVTSGSGGETTFISRNTSCLLLEKNATLKRLISMANELESITGNDSLDIEYAIGCNDELFLLQVRPFNCREYRSDSDFFSKLQAASLKIENILGNKSGSYGKFSILSDMCDWNPAEMIGSNPSKLSVSLYDLIFMKNSWKSGRAKLGYYEPNVGSLMTVIGGRPYIDVRSCFNSFLPKNLNESLSEKLINFFLNRLVDNPSSHDKVEFEVISTCFTFDYEDIEKELLSKDFTQLEVSQYRRELLALTDRIISSSDDIFNHTEKLVEQSNLNLLSFKGSKESDLNQDWLRKLLNDCIELVAVPFSTIVRQFFIGEALLKSAVNRGFLSVEQYNDFYRSFNTVLGELVIDSKKMQSNLILESDFIEKYGHLRPGTYDITKKSYRERNDLFKKNSIDVELLEGDLNYDFNKYEFGKFQDALQEHRLYFDVKDLFTFVKRSSQLREILKFQLSKYLEQVFRYVRFKGERFNKSIDQISHLDINTLLFCDVDNEGDYIDSCIRKNYSNKKDSAYFELPDIIFSKDDINIVSHVIRRPNFITTKTVTGVVFLLDKADLDELECLKGKIVVLERADPGYDWIFTKGILGLITKYGGAASHMSIRCSELSVPAAIGCGKLIFERIFFDNITIELDCKNNTINTNI